MTSGSYLRHDAVVSRVLAIANVVAALVCVVVILMFVDQPWVSAWLGFSALFNLGVAAWLVRLMP